ncbi:MAG TPA: PBP1A family penicillin-binding protein [Candidatus Moranbacteria bacterium]|nr:PBP1A family penicillin-binding protein [Candidatus Moranbacteria bacterium]HRZ33991.1 PBP1A family penicillin-binding protein [Candidatus Moranbacteria bacterium]
MKDKVIKKINAFFPQIREKTFSFRNIAIIIGILLAGTILWLYYGAVPSADQLIKRKIAQTSIIYDSTGEHVLYELYGEENRRLVSHDEIPDYMRIAIIATEDANFYHHIGIDPMAILRAIKVNIKHNEIRQGASTITQQLARMAFLTKEQTLKRKVLEAVFAIKMEINYTKDEILDQYINEIPFGANTYGVETASETYFGKKAIELTLDEAAFLAALPKATSYYSPYSSNRNALVIRQKDILQKISDTRLITKEEMQKAMSVNTLEKVKPLSQPIVAPHFVFFVLDELEKKYGEDFIQTGGLKIYTSLDYNMQKIAEDAVFRGSQKNISRGATNAALVAVDPKNGNVLVMVGSKDYFDKSIDGEVNIATSLRQPGSSFKPFAYAHAFELGYQPETMILDAETNFGPDGTGKDYIPVNYDGQFHGLLPLRSTLSMSLNIPAVKILYLAGIDGTIDLAHKMGITTLNDRKRYGLSLVLGGGEVKLVDMASAFSVFANDGIRNKARAITKITNSAGKIIQEGKIDPQRVLNEQVARKINSILSDNSARAPVFGSNSPLTLKGKTVAAKTGTTSGFRDAWTVGYTPSLAVGVWAGNNDNHAMKIGSDGVYVAAPIWNDFMIRVLANKSNEEFVPYEVVKDKEQIAGITARIVYYNNKSGKKISEDKAKKTDSDKVSIKLEYGYGKDDSGKFMNIAMPDPTDPMFNQWLDQFKNQKGKDEDEEDEEDD